MVTHKGASADSGEPDVTGNSYNQVIILAGVARRTRWRHRAKRSGTNLMVGAGEVAFLTADDKVTIVTAYVCSL